MSLGSVSLNDGEKMAKIKRRAARLARKVFNFPLHVLDWNKNRKDRKAGHLR